MELANGISDLLEPAHKAWFEADILPQYLKARRWFASKDKTIKSVRVGAAGVADFDEGQLLFGEIDVEFDEKSDRYQLPLGIWRSGNENMALAEQLKLADVFNSGEPCFVTDAFSLDALPRGLLSAMQIGKTFRVDHGEIRCLALPGFSQVLGATDNKIRRLSAEQSNSSLVIGDGLIMKLIRRVMPGVNPEVEMVRYLTESLYANTPPLLGEVQHVHDDGSSYSMFVVQKFIDNQGDAWSYTLETLAHARSSYDTYLQFVTVVGSRLAQLHEVLARQTDDPSFSPRMAKESDVDGWITGATAQIELAFNALLSVAQISNAAIVDRDFVLIHKQAVIDAVAALGRAGVGSWLTRIHGDFHLGQILVSGDDAYIIDFEGEPSKSLEARRSKSSPMRDVAGLLRSLQYAAFASDAPPEGFIEQMTCEFLKAYRRVHQNAARPWFIDERQETLLLDFFLLEKCAYEICYEAANRPSWLPIPLRGFARIIADILRLSPEIKNA